MPPYSYPTTLTRLLPASLDLDAHLATQPPAFAPFSRDALVQLLHLVMTLPLTNRKLAARARRNGGYVPLKAARLQKILPNYADYLRYAQATDLLETDNAYLVGKKCRCYRLPLALADDDDGQPEVLTPPLALGVAAPTPQPAVPASEAPASGALPACRVEVLRDPDLLRRWHARNRRPSAELAAQWREYVALLEWLDPRSSPLRIREAEARAFSEAEHRRHLAARASYAPHVPKPDGRYLQRLLTIHKLTERDFHPVFDRQGRLHTALTNTSRTLRPFIYAEGQAQLVALDLRNSQPFLSTLLLRQDFYMEPFKRGRKGSRVPVLLQVEGQRQYAELQRTDPTFFLELAAVLPAADPVNPADLPADVKLLRELTSQGQFYHHMLAAFQQALGDPAMTLEQTKKMMLWIMFARNRKRKAGRAPHPDPAEAKRRPKKPRLGKSQRARCRAVFDTMFPTLSAIFVAYKAANHKVLACLLQALEAALFLKVLAPRLRQKFPDMPLWSIHDCLILPMSHVDKAEAVLVQVLTERVGLAPQFGRKAWGSDPDWSN